MIEYTDIPANYRSQTEKQIHVNDFIKVLLKKKQFMLKQINNLKINCEYCTAS